MTLNKSITHASAFLAIGLSLLNFETPAQAQGNSSGNDIYDLDQMVIVANRTEIRRDQVGSSVEILNTYDLEKSNQAFLLDSIRLIPGFYLRNNGSPGAAFGITTRGLNSNQPTVLIDGIEVDNPANGQIINFGNLFGNNVSRVEILKGPQSSLYGANALAGVVGIQTKDGKTDPGSEAGVSYGSHDTLSANLGTRGADGKLSWAFNLRYYEQAFSVQDPDFGPEWADDDKYENLQTSLKLEYELSDTASLNFFSYWFDTYAEFDPGDPNNQFGAPNLINFSETTQFFSRVGGEFEHSDQWESTAGIAYTNVDSASVTGGRFPNDGDRYTYDWKHTVAVQDNWTLVGGVEFEEEYQQSGTASRDNTSVFVENIVNGSEAFDWTVGGRYDDNSAYGSETTWRSTFSYKLAASHSRIRGSYGTSFQAPSFFQLFSSFGDPGLMAESGEGWDLAFEQVFADGKGLFSSTLFGNEVEDKIIFSFNTFTYANEDMYESEGIENALRYDFSDQVSTTLAHTYSDANYADGTEAERVPRNIISLTVDLQPSDRLNLSVTALAVSSQFSLRNSSPKQEGYEVVNVSAQYEVSEDMQLWARIDNLFDEDYEEILTYQTFGFSVYGGVRINF